MEYSDFLGHLSIAKSSIPVLNVLDDYSENERMCNKLPARLKWKWARKVSKFQENECRYPEFLEFYNFVKEEAKIGQLPLTKGFTSKGRSGYSETRTPGQYKNVFSTTVAKGCLFCNLTCHETCDCEKLNALTRDERSAEIRRLRLCYKCLGLGHQYKDCATRLNCKICGKGHASAHHDPNFKPRQD